MLRLAWFDGEPKVEASQPWALEEVLARVVLHRQSNQPLQRTGPAPAFVIRGVGRAGPAAERQVRWADGAKLR